MLALPKVLKSRPRKKRKIHLLANDKLKKIRKIHFYIDPVLKDMADALGVTIGPSLCPRTIDLLFEVVRTAQIQKLAKEQVIDLLKEG